MEVALTGEFHIPQYLHSGKPTTFGPPKSGLFTEVKMNDTSRNIQVIFKEKSLIQIGWSLNMQDYGPEIKTLITCDSINNFHDNINNKNKNLVIVLHNYYAVIAFDLVSVIVQNISKECH